MLSSTTPLRLLRQLRGITLSHFSLITGFSEGHLCKLEQGRLPLARPQTIECLAFALKVDPRALSYPVVIDNNEFITLEKWEALIKLTKNGEL